MGIAARVVNSASRNCIRSAFRGVEELSLRVVVYTSRLRRHRLRQQRHRSTLLYPLRALCLLAPLILLMTACQPDLSNPPAQKDPVHGGYSMFPLRFVVHSFQAYCYNTLACKVIYNDYDFARLDAHKPSGPTPPGDYRDDWGPASHAGIRNFPRPAEVTWTALDGSAHQATVDIGAIFKDEHVLYNVPDSDIPDRSWSGEPGIFLEVNGRTVSVYMQAFVATKTEQVPGNKYSYVRNDVIRAWTRTY